MNRDKRPLVSIIIPVYNVEKYLKDCVGSVLSQTYTNLEVILVDDGSPDKSGDMCDAFAKEDSRIKVVHKENEGLNFARKTGFENSIGEWILFVDSDDAIRGDTVAILLDSARESSVDLAIGGYVKFSKEVPKTQLQSAAVEARHLSKDEAIHGLLLGTGHSNVLMMTAWGKLYRRRAIEAVNWNASNYRSNEDEFMALQYYPLMENGAVLVPQELYFYRENPDSITRAEFKNSFEGKSLDRFDTIERIYQEARTRLGDKYIDFILAKFIYEFILVTNKEMVSDGSAQRVAAAYVKYFQPKQELFTEGAVAHVDPRTRSQYDGLMAGGAVGCLRAKSEFLERENEETIRYMHSLEASLAERDRVISHSEVELGALREEITELRRQPKVVRLVGRLIRKVINRASR